MTRLDDYRSALLAAFDEIGNDELDAVLDRSGDGFANFVIDHGLGPLWHERTGSQDFLKSRMAAEAMFLAQENALGEVTDVLKSAGIVSAIIKGSANRLLLYPAPGLRACYDLDVLVTADSRVVAAKALVAAGFEAWPKEENVSRELLLKRGAIDIDLHWGLLREGRLRVDITGDMLARRRRHDNIWMLSKEDTLFLLLVHPAFAKHLSGWNMGLHRVADIIFWLRRQEFDWPVVCGRLQRCGVKTAAWATLRWVELVSEPQQILGLREMMADIRPGLLRRKWVTHWLENDWPARTVGRHWLRLAAFSPFLHDAPRDVIRALLARRRAGRRVLDDLAVFDDLFAQ